MAGLATAQFTNALKILYLDPLEDQIVRKSVLLNRLEPSSEDIEGKHAYVALQTTRNPGVGFRKDVSGSGPNIPPAGTGGYDKATFDMAYHYGRGQVSGPVMRESKTNKGAFAKAFDAEMRNLMDSAPEDLNRKLWVSGNGRAATLIGTAQATSVSIEVSSSSYFPAKVGDRVHFADITAGTGITPATGTTINSIARDTDATGAASTTKHTVVLAAASGTSLTTADDAMYFGGGETIDANKTSRAQTMHGIPDVVNDGAMGSDESTVGEGAEYLAGSVNFGGIDRSSNLFWRAQNLSNSGTLRPLTVALLQKAWLTAQHVGGVDPAKLDMFTCPDIFATAGLLFVGDRRLSDSMELVGGFTSVKFNGSLMFVDRDCPRHIIWFLDMESILWLTQGGYEFIDDDGSMLNRVSDVHAFEFSIVRDGNIGARKCKSSLRLGDLQSTVTGVEYDQ